MAIDPMFINDAGGKFKIPLKDDGNKTVAYLLWGDQVRVEEEKGDSVRVKTGRFVNGGWIPRSALTRESLMEIYVIDVGQGDGVLVRTMDDRWHVVDAGIANEKQMTKKGAATFIRWKFQEDLGRKTVSLQNVILTHPDFDHYGGMLDLLSGTLYDGRTFPVEVVHFWHSGMGRFAKEPKLGRSVTGSVADLPSPDYGFDARGEFIIELLDDKLSFSQPTRPFEPTFAQLAALVASVPQEVGRLSQDTHFLPGYEPGTGPVAIQVLGPILEKVIDKGFGLRRLSSESVTRNGHSVVLRLDYDKVRVLLTGDLNTYSQRLLLSYHPIQDFAVDVAKGCHHGSDDIEARFVRALSARATIVSSGDNEDYAHPRPQVLGASARYGREAKGVKGEVLAPLLYSTELARSVRLCYAAGVRKKGDDKSLIKGPDAEIKPAEAGAKFRPLGITPISTDLVYGLVNVRTDGKRVLLGYMKENGNDFDIQVFRAGVEP